MGTAYTTTYTTRNPSATDIQLRSYNDKIRWLFPGSAVIFAFVSYGEMKGGELVKRPGMLGKKKSARGRRFEYFTYSPIANTATVSSTDGTNHTMDSIEGFLLKRSVINSRTLEVGRISSVTGSIITVTAVSSTFVPLANDVLFVMAPAYEEGSTSPYSVRKTEDNDYNNMQIIRYPIKISKSAIRTDNIGVANMRDELLRRTAVEGNILSERNFLFGERAQTSTTDLTTDATLGDSFSTMRGFWNMAQRSFSGSNSMTYERIFNDLPIAAGNTINPAEKGILLCGRRIFGEMQLMIQDKFQQVQGGELSRFGVKSYKFMTQSFDMEVVLHNLFDTGAFQNRALLLFPDVLHYVFREGRDFAEQKNIQPNDADYYEDEILGEVTCADLSSGYNTCKITDWFAL